MTKIEIHDVTEHFAELAARVAAGETVVVTRDGEPVLDIVPHRRNLEAVRAGVDAWKREAGVETIFEWDPDTFDEPMDEGSFLQTFDRGA